MTSTAKAQGLLAARPLPGAVIDTAIAAAVLGASLALLSHGPPWVRSGELNWVSGLLAACSAVPILAWRRGPVGVFAAAAAAGTLLASLGYSAGVPLGPTAALYLLAVSRDERRPWTRQTSLAVVGLLVGYFVATGAAQNGVPGTTLSHTSLAWAVAWFAGERTRLRHEHIDELEHRALRAEREAEREGRLAAAEERARIARDLHDSAGHAINVIVVRAGAARMRHDDDPQRSRTALEAIEDIARQTAAEIDQIVGTLRDRRCPSGTVDCPPGLASLDSLVAHHAAAGLEVTLSITGTRRTLTSAVDQAAYRILQEALTNASRHGAGAANVELAFGETVLELTVANPVLPDVPTRPTGGHGLIGMRERVTVVGGSFHEERADGDFRVCVRLAYRGHRL